jgi:hypothetical protein
MLWALKLFLPALVPSWRFFDRIGPSPRVEFALMEAGSREVGEWQEFRPRPAQLGAISMIARLFWNPRWNESLFLVSCATRVIDDEDAVATAEIARRVAAQIKARPGQCARFRLVQVTPSTRQTVFLSEEFHVGLPQ